MIDPTEPETTRPKHDNRWKPGQSGNPAGRPKGARHAALQALDAIGTASADALVRKAVDLALAGDMQAMRILMDRVWPTAKGRTVVVDLPELRAPGDLVAALAAVVEAVASGQATPDEGQALAAMVETQRRAIETQVLEARIVALEERAAR